MVQTANLRKRDDPADFRPLDWPRLRRILVQAKAKVSPALVVIGYESSEVAAKAVFRQDDYVIEAFASNRADHPFDEGALPG